MATVSEGFWPSDIKPDIQLPINILLPRADELTRLTTGVLVGEVTTAQDAGKKYTYHHLDVVVPALKNFRQRLVTVDHREQMVYPAFVKGPFDGARVPASTDQELVVLLKQTLHSDLVKSVLVSLIAQANQAMKEKHGYASKPPPSEQGNGDDSSEPSSEREDNG